MMSPEALGAMAIYQWLAALAEREENMEDEWLVYLEARDCLVTHTPFDLYRDKYGAPDESLTPFTKESAADFARIAAKHTGGRAIIYRAHAVVEPPCEHCGK